MIAGIFKICIALALFSFILCDEKSWQLTNVRKVTSLIGVYATAPNEVYGAMMDNSVGIGLIHSADYGETSDYTNFGAMNMDVAFTSDAKVGCVAGLGGLFVGPNANGNYTKVANVHGVTQNVEPFLAKGFGSTGQFMSGKTSVNGVAVSSDAGNSWNFYDIGLGTGYSARYGSFPTESTWYVSSGMFPSDSTSVNTQHRLSKNLVYTTNNKLEFSKVGRVGDDTGYQGAISKTTDGGKTWTQVFDTNGVYYMNAISCADELNCIAVGENDTGYIVGTQDGGKTWKTLYVAEGISLIAVKMISTTEAWASGGGENSRRQLVGSYYHTTDGGVTWELLTASGYAFDLSFNGEVGYSAALTSSYGTIAVYK